MSSINTVSIGGRLGRDPEARYTPSGTAVVDFSVAVDGYAKNRDEKKTHWINCKAWGATAEFLARNAAKGARVFLTGELNQETWEDRNGGGRRERHVVVARQIALVDWRDTGQASPRTPASEAPPPSETQSQNEGMFDDIPF